MSPWLSLLWIHDDVIKWKQWRGALMFSLIRVWINRWVNNGEGGDLRRYRAHYDVIVMSTDYRGGIPFSQIIATHLKIRVPQISSFGARSSKTLLNGRICSTVDPAHDDVIKWKHFPRYWPFMRGIHWSPVNSPHKERPETRSYDISLICTWRNGWVSNRDAGDLRRHRAHCDVTVMNGFWETLMFHLYDYTLKIRYTVLTLLCIVLV